jgi:putative membrane protein
MKTATFFTAVLLATAPSAFAQSSGPTDPQIAAIVVTANQVDIDAGKLAKTKGQAAEVKALAERMITDHTNVNQSATDLVHKLNVKPEPNPTSASLQKSADANLQNLKGLQGAAFDKAYVANEVTYHQTVIDALDKTLIPNAQNKELKNLLVKVRPAFLAHLEHAKYLQSKLDKTAAGS